MAKPEVPIDVDETTGIWRVDGMPMILVPRHFFVNNHSAVEDALGEKRYAGQLFAAGHKSAYVWCEKEAKTHGLGGIAVFHHYMKRLSQRGWGQFSVEAIDPERGTGRVRVENSVFVLERHGAEPRKTCYMFRGWFCGALEYVTGALGKTAKLTAAEVRCAAEAQHDHCLFEIAPT